MRGSLSSPANVRLKTEASSELLILPDGGILAHNLTPALAEILAELVPDDPELRQRASSRKRDVSWLCKKG